MNVMKIDLYTDWLDTVKEIFRGSGYPLPEEMDDRDVAMSYFLQTAQSEADAALQLEANQERLATVQKLIGDHFETVILPDIRSRTAYTGDRFVFKWVYNQGEHVVEQHSMYRIPL